MLFCATGLWAQTLVDGIYYNFDASTQTASVVKGGKKYSGSITIPSTVTYGGTTYSVTSIGYEAFYNCGGLTSVTIPNSVTSIGSSAFYDCDGLTSVTIPNSVTNIGSSAFGNVKHIIYTGSATGSPWGAIAVNGFVDGDFVFSDATKIQFVAYIGNGGHVTIPNSVTSIGDEAFRECGLTSITIPNSVTSIGDNAFDGCSGLTSITIPNSVTSIGKLAFYNCGGLTSVTIPNSVTSIGSSAFYNVKHIIYTGSATGSPWGAIAVNGFVDGDFVFSNATKTQFVAYIGNGGHVTIPNSVTSIGSSAFSNCSGLTSVTIPNSVTSIGNSAFRNCSGLTSVTIPNSVTSIGSSAFSGCNGLTSVTIPNSVTSIGNYAFKNCSGLTSVTIPNTVTSIGEDAFYGTAWYSNQPDGVVYAGKVAYEYKGTMPSNSTSIVLKDGTLGIADRAFFNCSRLTSVTIPNSVTSIGNEAFRYCSGLTSVTIPNSVTSIGSSAFSNCSGLTSVTIPNSVTTIESSAFYGCTGLTNITIPNSVTSIEGGAFSNCSGLTSVTIPNSVTSIGNYAFKNCSGLTSVTIPNTVTSIGEDAFYGTAWYSNQPDGVVYAGKVAYKYKGTMPSSTSIVLKDGTVGIADYAFSSYSSLTGVTIPSSVTSIGSYAFSDCRGLTSITIPNSVTTIESHAFYRCTGLTSVTIGNGVTSMGSHVFDDTAWFNNQPDGLVYAGKIAYEYKGPKPNYGTSIVLKDGTLGIADYAFDHCTGLTSIDIPNSVIKIGEDAFLDCGGLTSVTIPNSVTSIGDYAFNKCSGLTSITIPNSVTSIGSYVFYRCTGLTSIIVPCEKHDYFVGMLTEYAAIIYENCTFEVAVNANNEDYGTVTGSGVFKMGQTIQLTATANEGYRFKGWSDGVMDASREITVTKDTSITANFVALYTIKALASASQGSVSGGGIYEDGETATLVANAKAGYTFAQWVDGNDENPRTVTVNGNKTYTAIFAIDEHNVTLSKNISAAGTVTGDGVYEHNTTVQLTATANEGYRFKGWSDGVTDASREITVTKDTCITANFVALYTIKALASASQGTVIGGGVYEDGETVTLVANPNPGYIFAQWVDGSDENPRNVTVNGNKTYTAYFIEGEQDKYIITWKNWDGRVIKTSEVSYGEVPVFNGEKPTRLDEAGYTFTFNGWSPTIAAASQNAEYTANYIQTATEAEKTTIGDEGTVNITTTDNTALFTWPENASADTYTLTITRNDEVFCSLTFDGQGRLINLNFPNLRASAEGYQFTVTGLNSGTDYAYDLKAKNGAATVNEYTGEFRTSDGVATAAPEAEESIVETARYDINGRPLNAPTKGVNIVKYSDGSFEKEFVK